MTSRYDFTLISASMVYKLLIKEVEQSLQERRHNAEHRQPTEITCF